MKLPDNIQWVVSIPPHILKYRYSRVKNPPVGTEKGLSRVEGYGITDTGFVCIVTTCRCSGYTAVRFQTRKDWFGASQTQCRICNPVKPKEVRKPKTTIKGWGIM